MSKKATFTDLRKQWPKSKVFQILELLEWYVKQKPKRRLGA